MSSSEDKKLLKFICPYCKKSFKRNVDYVKKEGLYSLFIKNHPNSENCPPFIAFIDENGKHRGSQKIDNIEVDPSINEKVLESARNRINELKNTLRFYHLRMSRREGRSFEHKIANVKDKAFMSSKFYSTLINFLNAIEEENIFGTVMIEKNSDFEGGLLVYGKYLGMIYTIFWKDQKFHQDKTIDDIKGFANLTVEKLIDIYDLTDFFS
jgi:hypothetical protein